MNADPPTRIQRFGPEMWTEMEGRDWSLWDLWFCVVATLDHDGDLDALADTFIDALRSFGNHDRGANEAKLSQLTDLRAEIATSTRPTVSALARGATSRRRPPRNGRQEIAPRTTPSTLFDI